ncbi:MAG: hypothetical protein ACYTGZ_15675 [Planctomycetota bacterium]|jgi:hypothetical protein
MDKLALHLALHGVIVLTISLVAGLLLYRTILKNRDVASWHLVHASVAARGVMLIGLAAIIHLPALSPSLLASAAWLAIAFVWTSTAAMLIRAVSGERGLRCDGSLPNRLIFLLYGVGTIAIFPACALLMAGLVKALIAD